MNINDDLAARKSFKKVNALLLLRIHKYLLAPSFVPEPAKPRRTEPQPFNLYCALAAAKRRDIEEFNEMVRKGSKAWAGINGAEWVETLRGGDE